MSVLDYFSVKRKIKDLEDAITLIIEDQDNLRSEIKHVERITTGLKGRAAQIERAIPSDKNPTDSEPMTDEEFVQVHGCTPQEFATKKIRNGAWL